ncbi:MAG TPA: DUF4331 domain-containing protein [Anaerolineales bacterium]|nr:DUF4331 domain-containing protein [Anaerolineales bacterium]
MNGKKYTVATILAVIIAISLLSVSLAPQLSRAASHREAPLIALDPTADITDFFMFRSYEPGNEDKVVLIMDVIPGEEPSSGPNYFNFDPNVRYAFYVDNDMDGKADDVSFEFWFKNEFRGVPDALGLFLAYVGNIPPVDGSIVPPITALDGPGSEGLGMRQNYSVFMIKDGDRKLLGDGLFAVPSNVGPRTMPDYESLAAQGIYDLGNGVRVFAGQRDDPFYIDLGAVFDTLNLRPATVGGGGGGGAPDMLSGFNVHTIALELPASMLMTEDDDPDTPEITVLGAYASTSRKNVSVIGDDKKDELRQRRDLVQVQRLANPLINEAIIGTEDKDRWNRLDPSKEKMFEEYYTNPRLATALTLIFGVEASPLFDLRELLTYTSGDYTKLSELLRLNLNVPPTPLADQKRLTVFEGDNAGWPNGRRPIDDVTDIAIRVIGGKYFATAGDNVNGNDKPLTEDFPFIPSPWDGRNRFHVNP